MLAAAVKVRRPSSAEEEWKKKDDGRANKMETLERVSESQKEKDRR
jgi:hypothetical protein